MRARQRRKRQRLIVSGSALAIVLAILAVLIGPNLGSNTTSTTSSSTSSTSTASTSTSTSTPAKSVKGKPCVAVSDPLPTGAPAVPVQTGPPPTTLVKKDLQVGTGTVVTATQTLSVDYIGVSCSTGKIFDSSYKTGQPYSTTLEQVIQGWKQGMTGMKVGGTRLLGIPPALAYGSTGSPPDIAPDETLWFVVHVISAK
jgi:peptidylprolyl isomerase